MEKVPKMSSIQIQKLVQTIWELVFKFLQEKKTCQANTLKIIKQNNSNKWVAYKVSYESGLKVYIGLTGRF